jgi:hypothetical protein
MAYGKNAPFGLRPLSSISGGAWTEKTNKYYISTDANGQNSYGTNIFIGDPVIWNPAGASQGGGTIARYTFDNDQDVATNKVGVLGVFMGCSYTLPSGVYVTDAYWPGAINVMAGSKITALVLDDPDTVFSIQVSTWTNVLNDARFTYDRVGQNFGFGLAGGGGNLDPNNPTDGDLKTKQSAVYLAKVFVANNDNAVATLPLKVIGYDDNSLNLNNPISYTANNTTQPFLNVKVQINNHVYRPGTLGTVI